MPMKQCAEPGCNQLIPFRERRCPEHQIEDRKKRSRYQAKAACREHSWLYRTKRWLSMRKRVLKERGGLCELCKVDGRLTIAEHVHHVYEWETYDDFFENEFMILCPSCHMKAHRKGSGLFRKRATKE